MKIISRKIDLEGKCMTNSTIFRSILSFILGLKLKILLYCNLNVNFRKKTFVIEERFFIFFLKLLRIRLVLPVIYAMQSLQRPPASVSNM